MSSEDLLAWLRPFCGDDSKPVRVRIEVLQILEHSFSLSEQDVRLLVLFRSQAVLKACWPSREVRAHTHTVSLSLSLSLTRNEPTRHHVHKFLDFTQNYYYFSCCPVSGTFVRAARDNLPDTQLHDKIREKICEKKIQIIYLFIFLKSRLSSLI